MQRWFGSAPALAIVAGVALLGAFAALGLALSNSNTANGPIGTVDVTGNGTVMGSPDTLSVQLAVTTRAKSAAAALNQNNGEMHHLQAVFIGAGVKARDLQTSNLNVSPVYGQNGLSIVAYSAEDDLSATLRDIKRAGDVIDAAQNAVGNDVSINGISFSFSNNAPLLSKARVAAMQDAHNQALDYARGAGESLGRVIKITTQMQMPTPLPFAASGAAARPSGVPIRTGTETVSATVEVTYALG